MSKYIKKHPRFFENRREENGIVFKRCSRCKEWFPETEEYFYWKNKKYPEKGFVSECVKCARKIAANKYHENRDENVIKMRKRYKLIREKEIERDRQHRLKYPEYHKMKDKRWRQNNPEKCRWYAQLHRKHDVSSKEEQSMLKIFNYQCAYCGMTLKEHKKKYREKLHNDHVDDGGFNDLRNDVPACKGCNCSKHTQDMETWYRKQDFFNEDNFTKIIWWTTEGYKKYIEEDKLPYKIVRKKIYKDDDSFYWQYELWTIDEKRNIIECVDVKSKREYLDLSLIKENELILI